MSYGAAGAAMDTGRAWRGELVAAVTLLQELYDDILHTEGGGVIPVDEATIARLEDSLDKLAHATESQTAMTEGR